MKNITELDTAQSITTLAALWARMRELGAQTLGAIENGSISITFGDDGSVDRAFAALLDLGFRGHTVLLPRTVTHDGKRWRDAVVCMGDGGHIMLAGPTRPALEAV